jgi:hypothetical protein
VLQYDEHHALLKPHDTRSSLDLTYRILIFLTLLPLTLFDDAPINAEEYEVFFEENFASFVSCLTTDDDRIRYLTSIVARKLMVDGSATLLERSLELGQNGFSRNFWRSTYVQVQL